MTRLPRRSRPPGTLFLRIARVLFTEQTVSAVFVPAVADCQTELRESSASRVTHLLARGRWWWAFIVLLAVTPFSVSIPSIADRAPITRASSGGWLFVFLYGSLLAGAWWCVQEFMVAAIAAGVALACVMRAWNDRHPAIAAMPAPLATIVQINLAAIHVPGDPAGLIFAAGTILIVVIAFPGLWWFFAAAALGSLLVAWTRFASESAPRPLIANSISVR